MELAEFNALDADAAAEVVSVWAAIPWWVSEIIAGRPYRDVPALAHAASDAASRWSTADLDTALARHPRIGDKPADSGPEGAASRREQAAMATATDESTRAIATGNARYEARFGRVFLIRAAGRSPEEILGELHRRLDHDAETEAVEARDQLRQIALLRLETLITDPEDGPP